jgi:hypothetical protein
LAKAVLAKRFGPLSSAVEEKLSQWPEDRLAELIDLAYQIDSIDRLWRAEHSDPH